MWNCTWSAQLDDLGAFFYALSALVPQGMPNFVCREGWLLDFRRARLAGVKDGHLVNFLGGHGAHHIAHLGL